MDKRTVTRAAGSARVGRSIGSAMQAAFVAVICAGTALSPAPAYAEAPLTPPSSQRAEVETPADLYGALFDAVQRERVFPDSKTFVDMLPKGTAAETMRAFEAERPQGREALSSFVAKHFVSAVADPQPSPDLRTRIRQIWPSLARPPLAEEPGSTALTLPEAYIVPGGRYQEFYYWDTYFSMLGLKVDGEEALVEAMIGNFVSLVERYGHIPNGTRNYYLSRSQPPFLAMMIDLSTDTDPALARRRLDAMKGEYAYWMDGAGCLAATNACRHVVRMPDGSLLNRYWDARETPREESYLEDIETARLAPSRPAADVYRDLRAAAESGWDFSSRWLADGKTLATIETLSIVPVDLNSLMWNLETSIARRCGQSGDAACVRDFDTRAKSRAAAMNRYLWIGEDQRFADWHLRTRLPTPVVSAALLAPLFTGWASPEQAEATARLVETKLLAPGGLRTTLVRTGQQWDDPNGWAPLQWMAVDGLERYGEGKLAREIAERWISNVEDFYRATGRLVEKYDVEERRAGGGGEYAVQDGFGWTNGVTSALLERYRPSAREGGTDAPSPSGQ